jgi:hypothetical protein
MPMRRKALILSAAALFAGLGVSLFFYLRTLRDRRVEQEGATVVEAVRQVARLTTVEMNVSSFQLRRDSKNLLGFIPIKCEKTVAIIYRGKVAAGFDLEERDALAVSVIRSPAGRKVVVELPPPQLLYTDAPPPHVVVADGSVCNQFEPEDYEKLHADARAAAQAEALQKGILAKAEQHARDLVQAVAGSLGYEVEVKTRTRPRTLIRAFSESVSAGGGSLHP